MGRVEAVSPWMGAALLYGCLLAYECGISLINNAVISRSSPLPQSRLESVLREEMERMDLEGRDIVLEESDKDASYTTYEQGRYVVHLHGSHRCRAMIRHELAHAKHDFPQRKSFTAEWLHYLFIGEPRAIYYSVRKTF